MEAKITSSTGDAQATAVFDLLKDWKLVDRTVAVCFDTTASNTGIHMWCLLVAREENREKTITFGMSPPYSGACFGKRI